MRLGFAAAGTGGGIGASTVPVVTAVVASSTGSSSDGTGGAATGVGAGGWGEFVGAGGGLGNAHSIRFGENPELSNAQFATAVAAVIAVAIQPCPCGTYENIERNKREHVETLT